MNRPFLRCLYFCIKQLHFVTIVVWNNILDSWMVIPKTHVLFTGDKTLCILWDKNSYRRQLMTQKHKGEIFIPLEKKKFLRTREKKRTALGRVGCMIRYVCRCRWIFTSIIFISSLLSADKYSFLTEVHIFIKLSFSRLALSFFAASFSPTCILFANIMFALLVCKYTWLLLIFPFSLFVPKPSRFIHYLIRTCIRKIFVWKLDEHVLCLSWNKAGQEPLFNSPGVLYCGWRSLRCFNN